MCKPVFFLVGNVENRRIQMYLEVLRQEKIMCAGLFSWQDLLTDPSGLNRLFQQIENETGPDKTVFLRLESPGENFIVEKELLRLGIDAAEDEGIPVISSRHIDLLEYERGRILHPRQWYLGFVRILEQIARYTSDVSSNVSSNVIPTNAPVDIAVMFDKTTTWQRCHNGSISVPETIDNVHSTEELLSGMADHQWNRAFIKLAHGSSASGTGALYRSHNGDMRFVTTVELVRGPKGLRLYNSLKIKTYTNPTDITDIINTLAVQKIQVERWLPKALQDGMEFDLRIVVIGGEACHSVVRCSRSPMTNLHLGNRRGELDRAVQKMGNENWMSVCNTAVRAAALFPNSLTVGVDILIEPHYRSHSVLELNAFGDLLPRILYKGRNTYQQEVFVLCRKASSEFHV